LDVSDRGTLTGTRRDTITYVCQRAGDFTIPAVRLTWFDLDAQKLQIIDFPARKLHVAPNPAMESAPTGAANPARGDESRSLTGAFLWALVLNLAAALLWRTRAIWKPVLDRFQPVHLAPLNPKL